jgi:hypothetical protein
VRLAADGNVLLAAVLGGRARLIVENPQVDEILTAGGDYRLICKIEDNRLLLLVLRTWRAGSPEINSTRNTRPMGRRCGKTMSLPPLRI